MVMGSIRHHVSQRRRTPPPPPPPLLLLDTMYPRGDTAKTGAKRSRSRRMRSILARLYAEFPTLVSVDVCVCVWCVCVCGVCVFACSYTWSTRIHICDIYTHTCHIYTHTYHIYIPGEYWRTFPCKSSWQARHARTRCARHPRRFQATSASPSSCPSRCSPPSERRCCAGTCRGPRSEEDTCVSYEEEDTRVLCRHLQRTQEWGGYMCVIWGWGYMCVVPAPAEDTGK